MKIKKGTVNKIITLFSSILILINSFLPYLLIAPVLKPVGAQDEVTTTQEPTVVPTENPTPTTPAEVITESAPTLTPEISPTPTIETVTPTETVDITPTVEVTPVETITPTVEPTLIPVEKESVPSPPETTVTPTPLQTIKTDGTVETTLIESYSCRADSLNGCLATDTPTEIAVITGRGFLTTTIYTIRISSQDEPATSFEKEITTDENGGFTVSYQFDSNYRKNYTVELKSSDGSIVATASVNTSSIVEKVCLTDEQIINTTDENWEINTKDGIAQTKEPVKLGVKYVFPQENEVTVSFKCLPKDENLRTPLKIQQVKISDLKLPEGTNPAGEYAYDITTGMTDGTFEYNVSLPKSENSTANVSYIEKSIQEAKTNEVTADEVKKIDNTKLNQETDKVTASDIDHFTIFIATYADLGLTTTEATYLQGDTVYTNSTSLTSTKYYRVDIIEQNGTTIHSAANCTTGVTSLEGSYVLSASAPVGTNWKAQITKYDSLANCNASASKTDTGTATFGVKATSPVALANPTINPPCCGLDIALVIDNSNSIDSTELGQMKTALIGFVNALAGTPTEFSVTKFGTNASVIQTFTLNTTSVVNAINSVSTGGGGTNWKEGIIAARGTFDPRPTKPNLMIFASDGNPTYPSCGGATTCAADVNAAVTEANIAKSSPLNIRILTLGIGDGLLVENLKAISGNVVNGSTIMGSDVITTDFAGMATKLADFAKQTCGGTITVNKYYDDTSHKAGTGWTFNIAGNSKTTDSNGQTDTVTIPAGNTVSVTETGMVSGYTFGSASCKTSTGASVGSSITNGVGSITVGADDIITCNFINTTNKGSIELKKVWVGTGGQTTLNIGTTVGGTETASVQTGAAGAAPLTTGTKTVNTGTYYVSETGGLTNYNSTLACTDNGSPTTPGTSNSLSVATGHAVICTFTNTLQQAHITLVKTVTNDNGGNAVTTAWTLVASGNTPISGITGSAAVTNAAVSPGTYTLSESSGPSGYTPGTFSCVKNGGSAVVSNSISLASGDTATCSINNNDNVPALHLRKTVTNDNGGTAANTAWTLTAIGTGGSPTNLSGTTPVDSGASFKADTYTLGETGGPAGYTASSWSCIKNGGAAVVSNSITLGVGDTATCTITNDDIAPKLNVHKTIVPSSDTGKFDLQIDGYTFATNVGDGGATGNITVAVGRHNVGELAGTGANLSDYNISYGGDCDSTGYITLTVGDQKNCTITNTKIPKLTVNKVLSPSSDPGKFNLQINGHTYATDVVNGGTTGAQYANIGSNTFTEVAGTGTDLNNYTSVVSGTGCGGTSAAGTITLSAGDNKTCTITNTRKTGDLKVQKTVDDGSDLTKWSFTLDSTTTLQANASGLVDFGQITTGVDHDINESGPTSSYHVVSVTGTNCVPYHSGWAIATVTNGNTTTCTFNNARDTGTIIVHKDVQGPAGEDVTDTSNNFTVKIDGTNPQDLTDGGQYTYTNVLTGSHTITESDSPSNYTLYGISTTPGTSGNTSGLTVTVTSGLATNVYVTNRQQKATLTLVKKLPNDNGGTAVQTDFNVYINNILSSWGSNQVNPGSYTVKEDSITGYSPSDWGGDCSENGLITLKSNESKTCTISNNDDPPSLTLNKVLINDNGGTAVEGDWTLTATGPTTISGQGTSGDADVVSGSDFSAGTYILSESAGPTGYTASSWSCIKNGGDTLTSSTITLGLGDSAVCTITNNDIQPKLTVIKKIVGGSATTDEFDYYVVNNTGATQVQNNQQNGFNAGTYQVTETNKSGEGYTASYSGACDVDGYVTLLVGDEDKTCTITNTRDTGSLTVNKKIDTDANGTFESGNDVAEVLGFKWSTDSANINNVMGTSISSVPTGYYNIYENNVTNYHFVGWYQGEGSCENSELNSSTPTELQVTKDQDTNITLCNTRNTGDLKVIKTVDDKSDLTLWSFGVDGNQDHKKANTDGTVDLGNVTTSDTHTVTEYGPNGYALASVDNCTQTGVDSATVSLTTDGATCTFNNKLLHPGLQLSKSNDASGDKSPGDSVIYTLSLKVLDNSLNNVVIKDLLPKGFSFVNIVSSTLNGGLINLADPGYHSPGTYSLGNLKAGDEVIIQYQALIAGDEQPGLYKDAAYALGTDTSSTNRVLALAQPVGYISNNFVGTQVNVNAQLASTGSINITTNETGQVLGASTSLPSTGSDNIWIILADLLTIFGLIFLAIGLSIKRKLKIKIFGKILVGLLLFATFLTVSGKVQASSDLTVRLAQPKSPTGVNTFNITYVALDLSASPTDMTVKCFKKAPSDGSFSQFGSDISVVAGGNTGICNVDSNIVSSSGTYQFYVNAQTSSENSDSDIVTVDYNTSNNVGTPTNYSKDVVSSCQYKISFTTANDGVTSLVKIYHSTSTSFNLDDSTTAYSLSIGPNQSTSYTENVSDCSKTWYYVVRAFDSIGNGSGTVGDSAVTITTTTTVTNPTTGAIPVSNVTLPGAGGGSVMGAATGEGEVKGTATGTPVKPEVINVKNQTGAVKGTFTYITTHKKIALGVIILLGIIGYVYYVSKKNNPS